MRLEIRNELALYGRGWWCEYHPENYGSHIFLHKAFVRPVKNAGRYYYLCPDCAVALGAAYERSYFEDS